MVVVFWELCALPNVVSLQLVRFRGWFKMKKNEIPNALECLKPSGLDDWVKCRLCNGWVHIKCASLFRTEALRLAELGSCRCFLVNTIRQYPNDHFRPDTFINSGVDHVNRVSKKTTEPPSLRLDTPY